MTARERILAALQGEPVDKVPFTHWHRHFPRGQTEREVRNRGMALCLRLPCFLETRPNVEVIQSSTYTGGVRLIKHTYHTPLGEVYELRKAGIGLIPEIVVLLILKEKLLPVLLKTKMKSFMLKLI